MPTGKQLGSVRWQHISRMKDALFWLIKLVTYATSYHMGPVTPSTTDGAPLLLKALEAICGTIVSTNHVEKYNSNFASEDLQLTSSSPAACVVLTWPSRTLLTKVFFFFEFDPCPLNLSSILSNTTLNVSIVRKSRVPTKIRARGCRVRSAYATSVLCCPPFLQR